MRVDRCYRFNSLARNRGMRANRSARNFSVDVGFSILPRSPLIGGRGVQRSFVTAKRLDGSLLCLYWE